MKNNYYIILYVIWSVSEKHNTSFCRKDGSGTFLRTTNDKLQAYTASQPRPQSAEYFRLGLQYCYFAFYFRNALQFYSSHLPWYWITAHRNTSLTELINISGKRTVWTTTLPYLYHDPYFIRYIVNFSFAKSEEGLQWPIRPTRNAVYIEGY
jgi:hypothetical protein